MRSITRYVEFIRELMGNIEGVCEEHARLSPRKIQCPWDMEWDIDYSKRR